MPVITSNADLQALAKRRVPRMFYDYADSGAYTEGTYRDNTSAFTKYKLRQRVAVDISKRSVKTTMVGREVSMPVALAPVGLTGMQHADGEIAAAKAAEAFGIPFTLSTMSVCSIEEVAKHTTAPFWFQLYVMRDRGFHRGAYQAGLRCELRSVGADAGLCRSLASATRTSRTACPHRPSRPRQHS